MTKNEEGFFQDAVVNMGNPGNYSVPAVRQNSGKALINQHPQRLLKAFEYYGTVFLEARLASGDRGMSRKD